MMFFSLFKSRSKTLINTFHIPHHYCFYRTKRITGSTPDSSALRTSFLQNQCGLSGKSLIRASHLLNFDPSDERPISFLKLLQTFGFPQSNIAKIISKYPRILQFHSQKILKPKLDFLVSITHSETDVINIVTANPNILRSSLEKKLIPDLNLLNSLTGSYHNAAMALGFSCSNTTHFRPNIEFLFTVGVPSSQIVKLVTRYGYGSILGKKHDEFCTIVMKVKEMGFDLSSSYFLSAVRSLSFVSEPVWESKCEVLRSFGFSNDDILCMFNKLPDIFTYREKIIAERMEFFVKKLRWSPSRLVASSSLLCYSLEKRTIPRCSVLQVLVSKNKTTVSFMLSTVLAMTERKFLKNYVTPYKDEIPEIMDACNGKLKFDIYTFNQKRGLRTKQSSFKTSYIIELEG